MSFFLWIIRCLSPAQSSILRTVNHTNCGMTVINHDITDVMTSSRRIFIYTHTHTCKMTRPAFHTDISTVSCSRPLNQGSWGDIDMHDHVILPYLFSRTPKVSSESQAYRYSAPQNCPYEPHSFTQGKTSNLTS